MSGNEGFINPDEFMRFISNGAHDTEPDFTGLGTMLFKIYKGFVDGGFTEDQAIKVLSTLISSFMASMR